MCVVCVAPPQLVLARLVELACDLRRFGYVHMELIAMVCSLFYGSVAVWNESVRRARSRCVRARETNYFRDARGQKSGQFSHQCMILGSQSIYKLS